MVGKRHEKPLLAGRFDFSYFSDFFIFFSVRKLSDRSVLVLELIVQNKNTLKFTMFCDFPLLIREVKFKPMTETFLLFFKK